MFSELLMVLGATGLARDAVKSAKFNAEADRLGSPILVGCKNREQIVLKKSLNNRVHKKGGNCYIPLTDMELEWIRKRVIDRKSLHESVPQAYQMETGRSVYEDVGISKLEVLFDKRIAELKRMHPDRYEDFIKGIPMLEEYYLKVYKNK